MANTKALIDRVPERPAFTRDKNGRRHAAGRPRAAIDPGRIRQLAASQFTIAAIVVRIPCDPRTLSSRFATELAEGRERGKSVQVLLDEAIVPRNTRVLLKLAETMLPDWKEVRPIAAAANVNVGSVWSEIEILSTNQIEERFAKVNAELAALGKSK